MVLMVQKIRFMAQKFNYTHRQVHFNGNICMGSCSMTKTMEQKWCPLVSSTLTSRDIRILSFSTFTLISLVDTN